MKLLVARQRAPVQPPPRARALGAAAPVARPARSRRPRPRGGRARFRDRASPRWVLQQSAEKC